MAKSGLDKVVRHIYRVTAEEHWRSQADGELLRAFVRRGDQDAFAVLVKRYGPLVLATCRRVLRQLEDAEDAFQATFIVLARQARALVKNECVGGWLHRVAHRLALNARRALERRHHHERQSTAMNPTNPESEASWREVQVLLDDETQRLPERYRDPFILCALGGQSCAAAARQFGLKEGTVRSRLAEARKRLQARLSRRGVELTAVLGAAALAPSVATAQVGPALVAKAVSAATGAAVSASVSVLVKGLTASLAIKKAKVGVALFVVLSVLVGTASMWAVQSEPGGQEKAPLVQSVGKQEAAVKAERAVAKDIYGDPLPPGAVIRLGTIRLRAMGANLAWTLDGKTLVGVSGGSFLTFWDAASGRLKETRILPDEARFDSLLSADGQLLLSETLDVWDVSTGKLLHRLNPAKDGAHKAFSRDTRFVAAVIRKDSQFLIRCWDLKTGKQTFNTTVPRKGESSEFISFSPDGKKLLARLYGSPEVVGTYCWDLANGKLLWRNKETSNLIFNRPPCFSADGKYLLSVQPPLDVASGKAIEFDNLPRLEPGHFIAVPDGRTLLIVTKDGVLVWDMQAAKQVKMLAGARRRNDPRARMASRSLRTTVLCSVGTWPPASRFSRITSMTGTGRRSPDLLYSADGKKLASAGVDGSVRLWDTSTGRALKVWIGHDSRRSVGDHRSLAAGVTSLGMTPDAHLIVSAGSEERLRVWQTDNEKDNSTIALPQPPPGQSNRRVYHIRIFPEVGKFMALYGATFFAGLEGQEFDSMGWLATWDIQSGNLLTKRALGWADASFRFSRDGMTILSSSRAINSYSKETVPFEGANTGGNEFAAAFASDSSLVVNDSAHITGKPQLPRWYECLGNRNRERYLAFEKHKPTVSRPICFSSELPLFGRGHG